MGNKPCRIAIRIDEPQRAHRAGELVSGRIYFSATNKTDLSSFQGINLVLEGHEQVVLARNQESKHEYSRRVHESDPHVERSAKVLVRTEYPIARFEDGNKLKAGQYEYPFRWRLPADLPSSMHCGKRGKSDVYNFAEIRYTLSAKIVVPNLRIFESINGNKIDSITLNVAARGSDYPGQPIPVQTEDYPINTCFFWRNGSIRMGWDAGSDVCFPGSTLSVKVFGENQSPVPVRSLVVKLVETVNVQTSHYEMKKSFPRTIALERMSVENINCWKSRDNRRHASSEAIRSHLFNLKIPSDVRDSYGGDLIQVRHTLVVTAETPGLCTVTSPESSYQIHIARQITGDPTPITIPTDPPFNPDYQPMHMAEAEILPPDWTPVVANDVVVLPEACAVLVDEGAHQHATDESPAATPVRTMSPPTFRSASTGVSSGLVGVPTIDQLGQLVANCPENLSAVLNNDTAWTTLVQNLTPRDYCSVVERAGTKAPAVARTLAVTMGPSMKTRHLLACLYALPDSVHRMEVLRQTAPLASDVSNNLSLIEQELAPHELIHFRAAFQA